MLLLKKRIDEISNRFQELKSLAIKHKGSKDKEIDKLNQQLDSSKKV